MYRQFFKRLFDFCISLVALIIILPLLLVVTVWLHFANKGAGAFFFQERPGKNGKVFKVIKYKTMTDERDTEGNLLPDAQRLTKVGRFVRSISVDELPQLINVLKGDMALIGPRPLLPQYYPFYTKKESIRHSVRPGITGWAQVHGRNTVRWDDRLALDEYYVEKLSLWLDLKIIFMTIKNVLKRSGIVDVPDSMFENLDVERKKRVTKEELYDFMVDVDKDFIPTLTEQAGDLNDYSEKLIDKAQLLFEKDDQNLIKGIIAVYTYDKNSDYGFVTFVASNKQYRHQGIVRRLLEKTFDHCKNAGKKGVELFTHNPAAVRLYQSLGFEMLDNGKMRLKFE